MQEESAEKGDDDCSDEERQHLFAEARTESAPAELVDEQHEQPGESVYEEGIHESRVESYSIIDRLTRH